MSQMDHYTFRILLVEGDDTQARILEAKIHQHQLRLGIPDSIIHVERAPTLNHACYLLRQNPYYDAIYVDPGSNVESKSEILSELKLLSNSPITILSKQPRTEVDQTMGASHYTRLVNKRDLSEIESSLAQLICQAERKQHLVNGHASQGLPVAIARLESGLQNLWREIGDIKEEVADLRADVRVQITEMRTALQSIQANTLLAVDGIPSKMVELEIHSQKFEKELDKLSDSLGDIKDLAAALTLILKIVRFTKANWKIIGGGGLIPLALLLKDLIVH
ncbi:MAG TPA: hypothetical protein V6D07_18960 [Trichocoleus sp.]